MAQKNDFYKELTEHRAEELKDKLVVLNQDNHLERQNVDLAKIQDNFNYQLQ